MPVVLTGTSNAAPTSTVTLGVAPGVDATLMEDNVGSDLGGMPCQVIRPVTSLADATGGLPSEQQQSQSVQYSLTTVVDLDALD